ncbi:MAG: biotin/lipoyl-binding protein [Desulfurococcales archaeon]|nr:biotin/lipoyl-binding protein [Desulfurococcales archaeon]
MSREMPATYEVEVGGQKLTAYVEEVGPNTYKVKIGQSEFVINVASIQLLTTPSAPQPQPATPPLPTTHREESEEHIPHKSSEKGEGIPVKVEVPGRVLKVLVKEGQRVKAGETLVTVESMKMELEIKTPISGVVTKILVNVGESVNTGDVVAYVKG